MRQGPAGSPTAAPDMTINDETVQAGGCPGPVSGIHQAQAGARLTGAGRAVLLQRAPAGSSEASRLSGTLPPVSAPIRRTPSRGGWRWRKSSTMPAAGGWLVQDPLDGSDREARDLLDACSAQACSGGLAHVIIAAAGRPVAQLVLSGSSPLWRTSQPATCLPGRIAHVTAATRAVGLAARPRSVTCWRTGKLGQAGGASWDGAGVNTPARDPGRGRGWRLLPVRQAMTLTFSAWGPFWPWVMSSSTFCPSSRLRSRRR